MKTKKTAQFWLCTALILCFVSAIGASLVQTSFGKITIKDLEWETESGHKMSALLFIPENATRENPAPAIVCSHGWYNNREMQDLNYVEYARRGYVVMSIDMYGHGNSEVIENGTWFLPENNANGMYDAVKLMADLPYVDASKIGVTGHSNGALASRFAVLLDNEVENPLIASALLVSNDAVYTDADGNYINMFGNRDAAVIACQYDEFFHRVTQEDGTRSAPRDYIDQVTAQSFLNFGTDPKDLEKRESYNLYEKNIDGEEAIRAIYNPNITHPWAHFSMQVVTSSLEFFEASLPAPISIAPTNQIWIWKALFNGLGLVGFVMFMVHLAIILVKTKPFASLAATKEVVAHPSPTGKAKIWFWSSMIIGAIFSFSIYMFTSGLMGKIKPAFFTQSPVFFIGMWSLLCGLFTLLMLFIGGKIVGKNNFTESGVKISGQKLLLTILLALTVVAASYGLVFLADYFFKTDFRLWVLAIKAFDADKLPIVALYLPLFLTYYVMNSISINSFNNFKIGKKGSSNIAIMAAFNGLSSVVMVAIMYITFAISGHMPNEMIPWFGGSIIGIWLFPIIIILPLAAWISRKIYIVTNNPYLAPIIIALVVTIMACTNTLTVK